MKKRILEIIHGPAQIEAVYQLDREYRILETNKEKSEFIESIKEIAKSTNIKEQFAALTVIESLCKERECKELIKDIITSLDLGKNRMIIKPLLPLSSRLGNEWGKQFIREVLKKYKPQSKEYNYLYDLAIRSFILNPDWSEIINEINFLLKNNNEKFLIDFMAYFKWKKGKSKYKRLMNLLNSETLTKVSTLKCEINERYKNHYMLIG